MKKILRVLLRIIITIFILVMSYIGINEGMALYTQDKISAELLDTSERYIFMENREQEQKITDSFNAVLDQIPDQFAKKFKSQWIVVVAEHPPYEMSKLATIPSEKIAGLTLHSGKAIWISSDIDELYVSVFAHEIGHFIAYELRGTDYSETFYKIYEKYKDSYVQYGTETVSIYDSSTPNEFYATLCKEYICHPDYLKEHCIEGFEYIKTDFSQNPYSFFLSGYINEFLSTAYNIKAQIANNIQIYENLLNPKNPK